jgi:CDP-glycerol glycerophosphotransferase (TagB/SpsB family)
MQYPINSLKRNCNLEENVWKFANIFGIHFCFCKGKKCLESNIVQKCKFNFFINIIDKNRDLYLKTDYLFVDFIFSEISSDDAYPVFEEMEKQNYPAHYITEKKDIYQKYCNKESRCLKILLITKSNYLNDGDFLQNYFGLILKLKAFISAKPWCTNNIAELFYNIEYITYIAIGHGLCYFKDYLYKQNRLYGNLKNDKIVIPPSKKIIFMAKKYGWKDENIIKINLPRWDKYNNELKSNMNNNNKFSSQSILFMFTWRAIKKKKYISYYYIKNIISLLINSNLKKTLSQSKIALYFTFHRYIIDKYKAKFEEIISNNKYIYYLDQNEISDCLSKISLVVSDFSSIIFDSIYRRKPFIIYIPDANDNNIKNIYDDDYYQLIESLKNGTIYFENKFFNINSVIEKIIFYINNNFTLEKNLVKFYDSFELNQNTNINNFIKYLNNLK